MLVGIVNRVRIETFRSQRSDPAVWLHVFHNQTSLDRRINMPSWNRILFPFFHMIEVKLLTHVQLFVTPWTVAYQAPLPMGFSRQEYWVAISFSRGSSRPRDRTRVSRIVGRLFTIWATREVLKPIATSIPRLSPIQVLSRPNPA